MLGWVNFWFNYKFGCDERWGDDDANLVVMIHGEDVF